MLWYFLISHIVEGAEIWVLILTVTGCVNPGKGGHFLVLMLLTGELRISEAVV